MSYDPSQATGSTRAIQVDVNSQSILSSDITQHTYNAFIAKNIYFIDAREIHIKPYDGSGAIFYTNFNNFSQFGGEFKSNSLSAGNTSCDESYCAVNTRNTQLTVSTSSIGITSSVTINTFRSLWRVE